MRDSADPTPSRSWREIPQQVKTRAMSRTGRNRFLLSSVKTTATLVLGFSLAFGAYEVIRTWSAEPKKMAAAINTAPLKTIDVLTDGVLDRAWVTRTLALPNKVTLIELDLHPLQQRLLESGQVRSAVISKSFPATLTVKLAERSPVARLKGQIRDQDPQEFVVSRDGAVFAGVGYESEIRNSLPWLAGVKLVSQGKGFRPIEDMETVADLLAKARNEAPQLYQTWQVVDLSHLASDGEIVVSSTDIAKIVFSKNLDFFVQLARLDYARDQSGLRMKSVNLGLGPQVVATFDGATVVLPTRPAATERPRVPKPIFAFPNSQRSSRSQRDL